jgi:hypothetical protein
MAYWIATHYPHPVPDTIAWNIYFKTLPSNCPLVGDKVLFYESEKPSPGAKRKGRKALVKCGTITGKLRAARNAIPPWMHEVPCDAHDGTAIPLSAVRTIIPISPFFRHSAWPLDVSDFNALAAMMGCRYPNRGVERG